MPNIGPNPLADIIRQVERERGEQFLPDPEANFEEEGREEGGDLEQEMIPLREEAEQIREQRRVGERVAATRRSSATVYFVYEDGGKMIRVKLGGGGTGQVFHKEDLAQFAYWLMDEARKQALIERVDNGW